MEIWRPTDWQRTLHFVRHSCAYISTSLFELHDHGSNVGKEIRHWSEGRCARVMSQSLDTMASNHARLNWSVSDWSVSANHIFAPMLVAASKVPTNTFSQQESRAKQLQLSKVGR